MSDKIKAGDRRVVLVADSRPGLGGANYKSIHSLQDDLQILDVIHGKKANFFLTKEDIDLTGQLVVIEMLEERYSFNPDYSLWKVITEENADAATE